MDGESCEYWNLVNGSHVQHLAESRFGRITICTLGLPAVAGWGAFGFSDPTKLLCACKFAAIRLDEDMFPYVALTKDKTWQPGPYDGVELMLLHQHENTGGVVVLRKFKAGHTIPAHTHPNANEWAYVLSGEWDESGALFYAPKGVRHGPHVAKTEVISLTLFDGSLTVA